jgi:hypothetical protein
MMENRTACCRAGPDTACTAIAALVRRTKPPSTKRPRTVVAVCRRTRTSDGRLRSCHPNIGAVTPRLRDPAPPSTQPGDPRIVNCSAKPAVCRTMLIDHGGRARPQPVVPGKCRKRRQPTVEHSTPTTAAVRGHAPGRLVSEASRRRCRRDAPRGTGARTSRRRSRRSSHRGGRRRPAAAR